MVACFQWFVPPMICERYQNNLWQHRDESKLDDGFVRPWWFSIFRTQWLKKESVCVCSFPLDLYPMISPKIRGSMPPNYPIHRAIKPHWKRMNPHDIRKFCSPAVVSEFIFIHELSSSIPRVQLASSPLLFVSTELPISSTPDIPFNS